MIRSIQVEVTNVFRSKPIRKVRCQIGLLPHMAPLWPAYSMRHGPFLARLVFSNEKACSSHSAKNLSQFGQPASEVQIISSIKRSIILSPGRARRHCNRSNTDRRRDRTGEGEHYKAISRPRRCLCSMNSENHFWVSTFRWDKRRTKFAFVTLRHSVLVLDQSGTAVGSESTTTDKEGVERLCRQRREKVQRDNGLQRSLI